MEFLFCVFSSNPCILCANPYLNDIAKLVEITHTKIDIGTSF